MPIYPTPLKLITPQETKRCNLCGRVKNVMMCFSVEWNETHTNKRPKSKCKRCVNKERNRRRRRNATPEWIANKRLIQRRSYQRHRLEKIAKTRLNYDFRIYAATPPWARMGELYEEMKNIWKNRPDGMHVDHIYPIKGINSCGLNVPWNLQYLPAVDNLRKHNSLPLTSGPSV